MITIKDIINLRDGNYADLSESTKDWYVDYISESVFSSLESDMVEYLDETAAEKDAKAIKTSQLSKDGVDLFKRAKKLVKKDPAEAKKLANEAIKKFEQCKKLCESIQDDNVVINALKIGAKMIGGAVVGFAITALIAVITGAGSAFVMNVGLMASIVAEYAAFIFEGKKYGDAARQFSRQDRQKGSTGKIDLKTAITDSYKRAFPSGEITRLSMMEKYDKLIDRAKEIVNRDRMQSLIKQELAKN